MSIKASVLNQLIHFKVIRRSLDSMLQNCLPNSLYLKLKRRVAMVVSRHRAVKTTNQLRASNQCKEFAIVPWSNTRKKADLVLCCAFKGRHEILEKSILESLYNTQEYQIEWFICGSTAEDYQFIQNMAQKTGKVSGMIWNNNPLGEKWHFCVKTAGDLYDADLYAITGSDDILSYSLLNHVISKYKLAEKELTDVPAMYCANSWVVVRMSALGQFSSAIDCTFNLNEFYVPLGAGRFYTKHFMNEVGFKIFDAQRSNCLDDYGYHKIQELGYKIESYFPENGLLLSVKGNWAQMNQIEDILETDSIFNKDITFSMIDAFQKQLSPELYHYLLDGQEARETYAWA